MIDTKNITILAEKYTKISRECERNLPGESSAVQGLKKLVGDFRETMPIVEALGCKDLEPHHWEEITKIIETVTVIPETFSLEEKSFKLKELIDLNVAVV